MSVNIRPYRPTDLTNIVQYANNFNVSKYLSSTFPFPYTETDGTSFLAFATQLPDQLFAITYDDELIGGIGTTGQTERCNCYSAQVGLWVAEEYWGKGIATKAMKLLIEKLKDKFIRLYAYVVEGNEGSRRVLQKCGFVQEGMLKLGHYKDIVGFKDLYLLAWVQSPDNFAACKKETQSFKEPAP